MAQIGHIIEGIFQPGRKYEDYVQKYEGYVGSAGRLVSNKEYDSLRTYAAAAGANTQISFVLPTWSPRFHLAVARQVFAEMRAAHDRLYNILDAFLTFANSISVAQAQMGVMQEDSVAKRAERQKRDPKRRRAVTKVFPRPVQWPGAGPDEPNLLRLICRKGAVS